MLCIFRSAERMYRKCNFPRLRRWSFTLFFFASLIFSSTEASAFDIALAWDASPGATGYKLFHHEEGQNYNYNHPSCDVQDTNCAVFGLDATKTNYFVVRAYNAFGESGNSNEVMWSRESTNQKPVADIIASPTSGDSPLKVDFDAIGSYDPDGTIVSYVWEFGDGTFSGEALAGTLSNQGDKMEFMSPEAQFFSISYDIVLTGPTDMGVCLQSQERSPTNWNEFSYILNTNGGVFRVRDGDSYRADVEISYEAGKTYRVRMEGDVLAKTYDVYVTEDGTTTQIAYNYAIRDTASDATDIARIAYCGDDGATVTNVILNKDTIAVSGPQVTHTYSSNGTYTARLTVTDDGTPPLSDEEFVTITVNKVGSHPQRPTGLMIIN